MFLINFQLRARIREIPGAGSFYIRGGFNVRGKRLVAKSRFSGNLTFPLPHHWWGIHVHIVHRTSINQNHTKLIDGYIRLVGG